LALNGQGTKQSRSAKSIRGAKASCADTGQPSVAIPTSETCQPTDCTQMEFFQTPSAAASHAKTFHWQETVQALKAAAAACGASTPDLLAKLDPLSSSWKTSQRCLIEGWASFCETWPRSGLMLNGIAYQLPPLVRLTDATASGSWATPSSRDWKDFPGMATEAPRANGGTRKRNDQLARQVYQKKWPTPQATKRGADRKRSKRRSSDGAADLVTAVATLDGSGLLNPEWVGWLMGFPKGWTDCTRLEMPLFHTWPKSSGEQ
jgi:hypothetical protein